MRRKPKIEPEVSQEFSISLIWRLDELMRLYKITNNELSYLIEKTPSCVGKLKKKETLPRINSNYISAIIVALNYLRIKKLEKAPIFEKPKFSQAINFEDLVQIYQSDDIKPI